MLITEEIFQAFLECETKSYLKVSGSVGDRPEFSDWQRHLAEDCKQRCCIRLFSNFREDECFVDTLPPQDLEKSKHRLFINCVLQAEGIQSQIHALERITAPARTKHSLLIPIRFVSTEKIFKRDKLLLAFGALALSLASGKTPLFGKIIYGSNQKTAKVKMEPWIKTTKEIVERISTQQKSSNPPQLILKKHCSECEFQHRCHQTALEKDELSLLSGMTQKERKKLHENGIFTVIQLSYTFRSGKSLMRPDSKRLKYSHALRALAIRERKIHVVGRPEVNLDGNLVFFDVEGIPDRDFYYLIGLRVKNGDTYAQHSFWAHDSSEEQLVWTSFLQALGKIERPRLVHYGSYETTFLKRMKERYGNCDGERISVDQLITESLNILSIIYKRIYFPTYSNGLKDIAQFLGFRWSDSGPSGFNAINWRMEWECSKDLRLKQKLLTYNAEDCEALERVTDAVSRLCPRDGEGVMAEGNNNIVNTDSLRSKHPQRFGDIDFALPELHDINQAAYWDYQRQKIYIKSSKRLRRISKKGPLGRSHLLPIDKVTECSPPSYCPVCNAAEIFSVNSGTRSRTRVVYDLKFGRTSVKRWVVRYVSYCYACRQCGASFSSPQLPQTGERYGPNFLAYMVYQIIELQIPQITLARSFNLLFNFKLDRSMLNRQKLRAARLYQETYKRILSKIVSGSLIHADETKVSITGKGAYVWVITNLEEVAYFYTETRESDVIQGLLKDFKGVLVSDFYAGYDAIECPQQKCLIHMTRDLNDDLCRNPFNEEMKRLVQKFAMLVKPMVETIDRYGLKAHYLRKHQVDVEWFYKGLAKEAYKSEIAVKYKRRLEKSRDKLFTFLDYDGVPWNNNNAEHAIKVFARLRHVIRGTSTDRGIEAYLTLLSISETCKYKGIDFFKFLRSGDKDIDVFTQKTKHVKASCVVQQDALHYSDEVS